ncbi:MAG TPA: radical SAM protein [Chloroflexia bacterium]|nr:radical SAM protein [Chloroflexia bacterium]
MDALDKLSLLGEGAQFEVASSSAGSAKKKSLGPDAAALCSARETSGGKATRLLRVLQTNRCDRGCSYCPLRAQNDNVRRTRFEPEELAKLYLQFDSRRMVDGLFLSSGSDNSPDNSMEQVVKTAAVLREKYHYAGYIHLKVLPGTSFSLVEEAARLANRLSINLEAPSAERLGAISEEKNFFKDIVMRMEWISRMREERGWLPSGQSTQMIVGAGDETDREVLKTSSWLYRDLGLNRVYYAAFAPVAGTPLEDQAAASPRRQQRLYQSDWLLSEYGFGFEELPFRVDGGLPLGMDPKVAWALLNPARFPVEINFAEPEELLRVPGIGPLSASRIVALRGSFPFKTLESLKQTGAVVSRARDFITINGRYFGAPAELLLKAGQEAMKLKPEGRKKRDQNFSGLTQLTLPFEWSKETILPSRQTTALTDLAFD